MIPNDFSITGADRVVRDTVVVPRGGFVRIDDGRGTEIHVHQGLVWLTQHHDRKDRFLEAGDRFLLDRDGRTIAQAFSEATVTLLSPSDQPALRFEVVPAAVPPAPASAPSSSDAFATYSGAYGFVELARVVLAAAWDALARLVSPKADLPGGRHG